MRRFLVPMIVVVYAVGAIVALGNAWSNAKPEPSVFAATGLDTASTYALSRDMATRGARVVLASRDDRQARLADPVDLPEPAAKTQRRAKKKQDAAFPNDGKTKDRFEAKRAVLSRDKMVAAFQKAGVAAAHVVPEPALADPVPGRFASAPVTGALTGPLLAFADQAPSHATDAFAAIGGIMTDEFALPEDDDTLSDESASMPEDYDDYGATPDDAPLPDMRPRVQNRVQPDPEPEAERPARTERAAKPDKAEKPEKPGRSGALFAFAKPNDPAEDRSGAVKPFKNFFNRPKAGNGVAVYDISAAKVYMPDGSVLEAHSGIGKMADNPRYVHVKMNGPTPPHTYKLTMREKRFHGVEAIRMTPVNAKGMHGRTGILAHSYLLRGGRAESHGCVAFKDYPRFLKAFKQGKVRQLVVVPGGGGGKDPTIRVAKNGREA